MKNMKNKYKRVFNTVKKRWSNFTKSKKIIVSMVTIVIAGFIFFQARGSTDDEIQYQFTLVSSGSVTSFVSESGEITSTGLTKVPSTITGIVDKIYVENDQEVTRGDSLFLVTSTATDAERATAYSTYQSAVSALDIANSTYRSKQATADNVLDTLSGHDDDETFEQKDTRTTAESARDNAYYSVVSTKAALSKAWFSYQATIDGVVKATANGVVANLAIAEGQHVNALDDALLIVSNSGTWVTISVTENDVVEIESGQKVEISVDALPYEKLTGEVNRVDSVGTVDSGVVTYNIYILVDQLDTNVLPSMTVSVDITTKEVEGVLTIPNSAIKPYQGSKAVQIMDEDTGQIIYFPIKLGVTGNTKSEVVSGLTEGQQIIASSNSGPESRSGGIMPFGRGR